MGNLRRLGMGVGDVGGGGRGIEVVAVGGIYSIIDLLCFIVIYFLEICPVGRGG